MHDESDSDDFVEDQTSPEFQDFVMRKGATDDAKAMLAGRPRTRGERMHASEPSKKKAKPTNVG